MSLTVSEVTVRNVLTRTTGFLATVTSHSLQPYCGCSFGNSACGVGCYVRHNGHLLKGRRWGSFLEVRTNAAESYLQNCERERRWARRQIQTRPSSERKEIGEEEAQSTDEGRFSIFCSSSTDPFVPQESRYGITKSILTAMLDQPPDELVLQTHTHRIEDSLPLLLELNTRCRLRVHLSIETDRDPFPGLPPHASPVDRRFAACQRLREAGIRSVVTVAPLLPLADAPAFFRRIDDAADAVVVDHFIEGDGSRNGERTLRTPLAQAIESVNPDALRLEYRNEVVEIARAILPGRVGVSIDGFAGRFPPE